MNECRSSYRTPSYTARIVSAAADRRFTADDVRGVLKNPDAWWTVLVTDPLAIHVVPVIIRVRRLTPNVITAISVLIAIGSGACFLAGLPIAGALLFELARFADVMDGKVARLRATSTLAGGFFDVAGDLVRMVWVYSAVGIWLAQRNAVPQRLALLPTVVVLAWLWSNVQLKRHGASVAAPAPSQPPPAQPAPGWLARHRLASYPGSVDAAGVAISVAPLTANPTVVAVVLWTVVAGFYFPAAVRNVVKIFRMLAREDERRISAP
jgi:phosphatidylglycerophosphate synthase